MTTHLHVYQGRDIVVTYDLQRCVHSAECLRRLPAVFDRGKVPWVRPDAAAADEVAATVMQCPSGALHFQRLDGGAPEAVPAANSVKVVANGPLYAHGAIELVTPEGDLLLEETRAAFCRCGASDNKPFCDNSHLEIGFAEGGVLSENRVRVEAGIDTGGRLRVFASPKGSLKLRGDFELSGSRGETTYAGNRVSLCRCGASKSPPFCDHSHSEIDFQG